MHYKIKATGSTQGANNPLRKINGQTFATKKDAVECVYVALFDIIDSDGGCEFVRRNFDAGTFDDNDEAYLCACERYAQECKDYIWEHMSASEDGWTATIEEVEDDCE